MDLIEFRRAELGAEVPEDKLGDLVFVVVAHLGQQGVEGVPFVHRQAGLPRGQQSSGFVERDLEVGPDDAGAGVV